MTERPFNPEDWPRGEPPLYRGVVRFEHLPEGTGYSDALTTALVLINLLVVVLVAVGLWALSGR